MVTCSVNRLSRILLTCPVQVHFRLLTCSITSVTFAFFNPYVLCVSGMECLTYSFPSVSVRLLVCSLLGWWMPMFSRYMSLMEIHMSCRLLFKRVAMLPLKMSRCLVNAAHLVVIFVEYPCLGLWCCISVPGRCSSFQCFRSECSWYVLVYRFPSSPLSSTCSSSYFDFNFH